MYQVFYNILYLSIIGSILAIIVLILRKTFDKKISPTWKFAMWFLFLISLFVPFRFTIESQNSHEFLISSGIDKIELTKENLIANESGKIFVYIWISAMAIIFLYYIITSFVMRKRIGKEEVKDKKILKILENCKKQMEAKKEIKLIKQDYKKVPCIYGLFNTKILVTDEVLEKDEESLKYIFMHELAHFKRCDLILNKLLILITTIHWFNPIIWFCFKQIRQDMELKADEMVLNKIEKDEEKEYAKTLVRLLPISKEEKEPVKLLCVTDGKKNMERRIKMIKLSDKFKEYKALIGITTLLIVICVGTFIFTRIKPQEEQEVSKTNLVQYFETPNRIVYKEKDKDNYYVFNQGESSYTDILNEIISGFDSKENGQMLSNEEIEKIEKNENYIELDYDTISKNYVIAYEKENNNIIFRNDNGGQVVKKNLENKEKIKDLINRKISSHDASCYHMEDSKEYKVKNEIPRELFEANNSDLRQYEDGVYGIKIQSEEKLNEILERYNIELEEKIPSDVFDKADVIIMLSRYNIEKIETRIGGLTYYFTGDKRQDSYLPNIFVASKAINTNCVYRNMDNISGKVSYGSVINNNSTNIVNTSNSNVNNNTTVSSSNAYKTIRVTKEEAATIAEEEAKNKKYQYQGWVSDFSATEVWVDENGNYEISAELIYSLDDIHRLYYWEEDWAKDSNINNLFKGQPVWCIRLGDKNDPLTNLYIYVDANNGKVVGAGKASD